MQPITAIRFCKKLRGGSQSHLVAANDGNSYVVKAVNNPQHRRTLVNEWIATAVLQHLQIATPACAVIRLTEEFLTQNPSIVFETPHGRTLVQAGLHFGSRAISAIDHTIAHKLLCSGGTTRIANIRDFIGLLAADKWLANTDSRQILFTRQQGTNDLCATAIDHGFAFDGPRWTFMDGPLHGLFPWPGVYGTLRNMDDIEPWLECIAHITEALLANAARRMPKSWIEDDCSQLGMLLERLLRRRTRLPDIILAAIAARPERFPSWAPARNWRIGPSGELAWNRTSHAPCVATIPA